MMRLLRLALRELLSLRVLMALAVSVAVTTSVVTPMATQAFEARRAASDGADGAEVAGSDAFPDGVDPEGELAAPAGPTPDATPTPAPSPTATPTPTSPPTPTPTPTVTPTPTPLPQLTPVPIPTPTVPPTPTVTPPTPTPPPLTPTPTPTPTPATPTPTPTPTATPRSVDLAVAVDAPAEAGVSVATTATVTVTNAGPDTSPGATVTVIAAGATLVAPEGCDQSAAATVTCTIGSLEVGSTAIIDVAFTPADVAAVTLTTTVDGAAADPVLADNKAGVVVDVDPVADLGVEIGAFAGDATDDAVFGAGTVSIPVTFTNLGPADEVTGALALITVDGLTLAAAPDGCEADGAVLGCELDPIGDEPVVVTVEAIVDTDAETASVQASVDADVFDPDTDNNTDERTTSVLPGTDLAVALSPVGNLIRNGSGLVAVSVTNGGPSDATGVELDLTADGAEVVATGHDDPRCSVDAGELSCDIGDLADEASTTIYVALEVGDVAAVTLTATVGGAEVDPDTDNNTAVTDADNPPYVTTTGGPEPVFGAELTGDTTIIGNTSLSCGADDDTGSASDTITCGEVRSTREVLQDGPQVASRNNQWNMAYVDADDVDLPDDWAENSSGADLDIPDGAEVTFAALYWSASVGDSPESNDRLDDVLVSVQVPGEVPDDIADYTAVVADRDVQSLNGAYQSYADVTDLITGDGTVWVAGIEGDLGNDEYAGWSLVVVWSGGSTVRNVAVFDTFERVASADVVLEIGGFATPADGELSLGVTSYEGDLGLTGDGLAIVTTDADGVETGPVTFSDDANPADDVFNSSISADGVTLTGGDDHVPSYLNTLGFDLDVFTIAAPAARTAEFTFSTGGDVYWVGPIVVSGAR